jgi:hypothetical protein
MRILAVVVLLLLQAQDSKLPVPTAAEQKVVDADLRALFKEDFAKKDRDGKRVLGQKLLGQALDVKNTPASRYVLLAFARDLSAEALEFSTAFEAVDQLDKVYDLGKPPLTGATFSVNLNGQKAAAVNGARKYATGPGDSSLLAEAYLRLSRSALLAREFDDAATAADQAAKAAKDPVLAGRAGDLLKEIPEAKKEEEQAGKAKVTLETKADDAEANLVYGRYLIFVRKDLDNGIPCLAKGSDAGLRELAKKESTPPGQSQAQFDLGEGWWVLGEKEKSILQKKRYQARAKAWYEHALENAPGLVKVKILKRLDELESKASPETGMDLIRFVDPKKDTVTGTWVADGGSLVSTPGGSGARLQIPFLPPPEYDLKVVIEKKGAIHFVVILPTPESQCMVVFYGNECAMHMLENEVYSKENGFSSNRPVTLVFSVRRTRLMITADGKTLIDWQADYKKVSLQDYWKLPNTKALGIGGMQGATFSKVTLTTVSGQGKKLR